MDIHSELAKKKSLSIHPKLQGIKIPKSNENELIIPCRLSYYGFLLLNEKKEYVSDISTNRINETLCKINKQIDMILIDKKKEESKDYQQSKIIALRTLFVIGIVISFVMYMLVLYEVENFKERFIFIPLAILIGIVIVSLVIMVKGLMTVRVRINVDKQIGAAIDKIVKFENETYFNSVGYLMERNESFYWLVLKKIF